jgi:hypothetical protein
MPVHRVSLETEHRILEWAREHYPFWKFTLTFDDVLNKLMDEVKAMEDELNERE